MYNKHETNTESHNGSNIQQQINKNRIITLERQVPSLLFVPKRNIVVTPV